MTHLPIHMMIIPEIISIIVYLCLILHFTIIDLVRTERSISLNLSFIV